MRIGKEGMDGDSMEDGRKGKMEEGRWAHRPPFLLSPFSPYS